MNAPGSSRVGQILAVAAILFLPFSLFHWTCPFVSDQTIGNDYRVISIQQQMDLAFSMKMGSYPLYVPGYAGGQTASVFTMAQMCHPISLIAPLMPGYWNGKALEWNTLLRLLFLAAAHLALFSLLRRWKLGLLTALIVSTVAFYNLRMLDMFRYGASLESWTGHILLCTAIGYYCLEPKRRHSPLLVVGATYWLTCSGHPQMMYYGFMGVGMFLLVIPYFTAAVLPRPRPNFASVVTFWGRVAICIGVGVLLSSVYLVPFYLDFIRSNVGRVDASYAWADVQHDTLIGTFNNFFRPLRTELHHGFGGSSLIVAAALVPALRLFRVRVPSVIWAVWGFALFAFLHMQGGRAPVHHLAWQYLPFASSFRGGGRITVVMPVLLMLMVVWAMRAKPVPFRLGEQRFSLTPITILAGLAIALTGAYFLIPNTATPHNPTQNCYWPALYFRTPPWVEPVTIALGLTSLAALAGRDTLRRAKGIFGVLLAASVCLQLALLFPHCTFVQPKEDTPTLAQMRSARRIRLDSEAYLGDGLYAKPVAIQIQRSQLEPFLGKIFSTFVVADDQEHAYSMMSRGRSPDEAVVEGYEEGAALARSHQPFTQIVNRVELVHSSFNRLDFDVWSAGPSGFFGLSYPYSGRWRASVNGHGATVYRCNGAAHAVRIPAGRSRIRFYYWSHAAFLGLVITWATLAGVGIFASLRTLPGLPGVISAAIAVGVSAIVPALWHGGLYRGANLETTYSWEGPAQRDLRNTAYGRQTQMSSIYDYLFPHLYYAGRGVDGDRSPASGFATHLQENPAWMIDLGRARDIGIIVLHEGKTPPTKITQHNRPWNKRPLLLAISSDAKTWRAVGTIREPKQTDPLRITLDASTKARYVLVRASGMCCLALNEVEIYPSAEE